MVQRFHIGKFYTLCLAREVDNDVYTFTANVLFNVRMKTKVEFKDSEYYYMVNLDDKSCTRTNRITQETLSCTCTNIVAGCQW